MKLSESDHNFCLKACSHSKATESEKEFLSAMASCYAANESVSIEDYNKMQRLTGGHLSTITPIFDR